MATIVLLLVSLASACARPSAIDVAVSFGSNWKLGPVVLSDDEVVVIKRTALATLRHAYEGFAVTFSEGDVGDRMIRLDRNLMRTGATPVASKVSSVSLDGVHLTLVTVAGCHDIVSCKTYTRAQFVEALGRGIGATAAHQLGHQAGFRFTLDSNCDSCYDGRSAKSHEHFFGRKHWSEPAMAIMNRVLPMLSSGPA